MKTRKLVILAMLLAFSLIIFVIEMQLPPLVPIPGIKLGLANIITLIALVWFGRREAFILLILRIVLGAMFTGGFTMLLYSAAGGMLCFAVMSLLLKPFKNNIWILSVFGALAHNAGQIAMAMIVTSAWQVVWYMPILAVSAVLTGAFTGFTAGFVIKRFSGIREKI